MNKRRITEAQVRAFIRAARAEGCNGSIVIETDVGKVTINQGGLQDGADTATIDNTLLERLRNRPWATQK